MPKEKIKPNKSEISLQKLAVANRIKRMRQDCSNIDVLRECCRLTSTDCPSKGIKCATCDDKSEIIRIIGGNQSQGRASFIRVEALTKALYRGSKTTVERLESGKSDFGDDIKTRYEEIFGKEYVKEYVEGINGVFIKHTEQAPNVCLCREKEIETLEKLVLKNKITFVCADGGVGKTTLVSQYIRDYGLGEFNYCQSIGFSNAEQFKEDDFLEKIDLTKEAEKELEKLFDKKDEKENKRIKKEFIKEKLKQLHLEIIFVLDDFTSVGQEILTLQEYPNCRFIITTRNVQDIGENYKDNILALSAFSFEEALQVFNTIRNKNLQPVSAEDFNPIYTFCEGNAEVLYYLACMLRSDPISCLNECLKELEFKAYDKGTNEQKTGKMAQKLSNLFKFDRFLPDLHTDASLDNEKGKLLRALATLSITQMDKIERESLVQFLTGDDTSELQARKALGGAEESGYIKTDGEFVWMHPLMANALVLNGIEKQQTTDVQIFGWIEKYDSYEYLAGLFNIFHGFEKIDIPRGVKRIPFITDNEDKIEEIKLGRDVKSVEATSFNSCKRLMNIETDENNVTFKSIDGNLYSKDGKIFVRYATGKTGDFSLPDGVEIIAEGAFRDCCIRKLEIPKTIKQFEEDAFYNAYVNEIHYKGTINDWASLVFESVDSNPLNQAGRIRTNTAGLYINDILQKDIIIDAKEISDYAFCNACFLEKVNILETVEKIGKWTFAKCEKLNRVQISLSNNLKIVDYYAFYNCEELETINLTNDITIAYRAFFGCKKLYDIGDLIFDENIHLYAFECCDLLEEKYNFHDLIISIDFKAGQRELFRRDDLGVAVFKGAGERIEITTAKKLLLEIERKQIDRNNK